MGAVHRGGGGFGRGGWHMGAQMELQRQEPSGSLGKQDPRVSQSGLCNFRKANHFSLLFGWSRSWAKTNTTEVGREVGKASTWCLPGWR